VKKVHRGAFLVQLDAMPQALPGRSVETAPRAGSPGSLKPSNASNAPPGASLQPPATGRNAANACRDASLGALVSPSVMLVPPVELPRKSPGAVKSAMLAATPRKMELQCASSASPGTCRISGGGLPARAVALGIGQGPRCRTTQTAKRTFKPLPAWSWSS